MFEDSDEGYAVSHKGHKTLLLMLQMTRYSLENTSDPTTCHVKSSISTLKVSVSEKCVIKDYVLWHGEACFIFLHYCKYEIK